MLLTNTMTQRKEELKPLRGNEVRIYACGPTVYNYFHIGNARPFVLFDVLRRYLEYRGYKVKFVQNLTDIDDRMINRARETGVTVKELGDHFIAEYFRDADALGIRRADVHPRATEHMEAIIALIQTLLDNGSAYIAQDGVYFDISTFPSYGALSGQSIDALDAGARVEVDDNKRHPADFALWKYEKPGEPAWDAAFGRGRPGWHIECSAMSMAHLGETFDIHAGGQDLCFPHHENERAQSEAATGKPFASIWLHNGFINMGEEKMSKSLGNVLTVRELSERFDLEVVRLFLLSAHYRSPISFTQELVETQKGALARLYEARDRWRFMRGAAADGVADAALAERLAGYKARFEAAMDDDLNTADALGVLFDMVRDCNTALTGSAARADFDAALEAYGALTGVLGLLTREEEAVPADVQALLDERAAARKAKDWARSDALRERIRGLGWNVEDSAQGQKVGRM